VWFLRGTGERWTKNRCPDLDGGVTAIETELVPAAEAMPEDKFGFAPTNGEFKGVRTFGQQVKHVAAVNYLVAGAILAKGHRSSTAARTGQTASSPRPIS